MKNSARGCFQIFTKPIMKTLHRREIPLLTQKEENNRQASVLCVYICARMCSVLYMHVGHIYIYINHK